MKYPVHAYVKAFLELLARHPEREVEIVRGFVKTLFVSGDIVYAKRILSGIREQIAKNQGKRYVRVYSARQLSPQNQEKIKNTFGENAFIEFFIVPEIIAGVKIVIDNETTIDATLKTKLRSLVK